jgi:tRNA threonylcarbamoyladenosine biosynthesis protein TsaE
MPVSEPSSLVLISNSPIDTLRIGRILGQGLKGGSCVALSGELGAGKTSLTQGIAEGLGVPDHFVVASPTFTLINEYPGAEVILYHLDFYRLNGAEDLDDIGYQEYLTGGGVMVIEWAEKIHEAIPDDALRIQCTYLDDEVRKMIMTDCSERISFWEQRMRRGGF